MLRLLQGYINSNELEFNPEFINLDIEIAALIAFKAFFPSSLVYCCRFHLGLAWFRKIKKSELANEYKDTSSEIGKLLNFFFGLKFLQPEKVSECFVEEIMSIAPSDQRCATFVDYVLENYVSEKVKVSPIMWAEAPSGKRRTTKERESFHHHFNDQFYSPHHALFPFIDVIKCAYFFLQMSCRYDNSEIRVVFV